MNIEAYLLKVIAITLSIATIAAVYCVVSHYFWLKKWYKKYPKKHN